MDDNLSKIGNGSVGESHTKMKGRVKELFSICIQKHGAQLFPNEPLEQTLEKCSVKVLGGIAIYQFFADFLFKFTYTKETKQSFFAPGTCVDYWNCFVQLGKELFPKEKIFENYLLDKSESAMNFGKIRNELKKKLNLRLIDEGRKLQENKSIPISRSIAMKCSAACINKNTIKFYENRAVLVTSWYTAGRASEGAYCSYDLFFWDYDCCNLRGEWNQHKVAHDKLVYFVSAYDGYVLDFYHSLACLRVVGNCNRNDYFSGVSGGNESWVFKNLAYASTPSNVLNDTLKAISYFWNSSDYDGRKQKNTCIVRELDSDSYTATSFRSGPQNYVLSHVACDHKHAIAISGHDYTNVCAAFEYLETLPKLVLNAQRALAGWSNVRGNTGQAPTLDLILDSIDTNRVGHFLSFIKDVLCIGSGSPLDDKGHLWPLSCTLMASLLQYLEEFVDDVGAMDCVVSNIITKGRSYGFYLQELYGFGKTIHNQWVAKNAMAKSTDESALQQCLLQMESLSCENQRLQVIIHLLSRPKVGIHPTIGRLCLIVPTIGRKSPDHWSAMFYYPDQRSAF